MLDKEFDPRKTTAVNPTADEVMTEVTASIEAACAPITIDADALSDFLYSYQPAFAQRLGVAFWEDEKANVLQAAEQHGIIAKALATLSGVTRVDKPTFRTASELVQSHCVARFGAEGVWCS